MSYAQPQNADRSIARVIRLQDHAPTRVDIDVCTWTGCQDTTHSWHSLSSHNSLILERLFVKLKLGDLLLTHHFYVLVCSAEIYVASSLLIHPYADIHRGFEVCNYVDCA